MYYYLQCLQDINYLPNTVIFSHRPLGGARELVGRQPRPVDALFAR